MLALDPAVLAHSTDALARLKAIDPASLPAVAGTPRLGVPVAGIRKIVAVGLNYADHAAETGSPKRPIRNARLRKPSASGGAAPSSTRSPVSSTRQKSRRLRLRSNPAYNIAQGLPSSQQDARSMTPRKALLHRIPPRGWRAFSRSALRGERGLPCARREAADNQGVQPMGVAGRCVAGGAPCGASPPTWVRPASKSAFGIRLASGF